MSLFLRLLALALLLAVIVPRGGGRYDRVLIVALDGVQRTYLDRLADAGELPALAGLRAHGVEIDLLGGPTGDPVPYWAALLGGGASSTDLLTRDTVGFLDGLADCGRRAILVHVPAIVDGADASVTMLPGPDAAQGFIGDSTGRVENLATLGRGTVSWPYRSAARDLARLADGIAIGGSSPWMEVVPGGEDARRGVFKVYRLDESVYYLSPVYRRTQALPAPIIAMPEGADPVYADALYVADDPSPTAASSRVREYMGVHAAELSRDRAEAARRMVAQGYDVMVVFETLPAILYAAETDRSPGSPAPTNSDFAAAYAQIDAQLGRLVAASGTGTLVVVIGREARIETGTGESADVTPTGFMIASTAEGAHVQAQASVAQVRATLLVAAGLPVPREGGSPIPAVNARYNAAFGRVRAAVARQPDAGRAMELSASTLERLGALATTAEIPAHDDAVTAEPDG